MRRVLFPVLPVILMIFALAITPAAAQSMPPVTQPSQGSDLSPEGAVKIVEIMTYYTLAVGAGFALGGMITSTFTNHVATVLVGSALGALAGNLIYAYELRKQSRAPLGEN